MTTKNINEKVQEFLERFCHQLEFPLDIERVIEERLELEIIPVNSLHKIAGVSAFLKSDFSGIVIDNSEYCDDRYRNRMRFSLTHEIGHFILHRDVFRGLNISSVEKYFDHIDELSEEMWCGLEWQANQFAGRLLVPEYDLEIKVRDALQEIERRGYNEFLTENGEEISSQITPHLGHHFGVSEVVIERRLRDEGYWPISKVCHENLATTL